MDWTLDKANCYYVLKMDQKTLGSIFLKYSRAETEMRKFSLGKVTC